MPQRPTPIDEALEGVLGKRCSQAKEVRAALRYWAVFFAGPWLFQALAY